jgi:hypothetical protein
MKSKKQFLKDVVIEVDRKTRQGYTYPVKINYYLAKIVGGWIHLYSKNGYERKYQLIDIHFHSYNGKSIKESTFKNYLNQAKKNIVNRFTTALIRKSLDK